MIPARTHLAVVVFLAATSASYSVCATELPSDIDKWRVTHESEIVSELDALTRLPSVAANPEGIRAAAGHLESDLMARGFTTEQFQARCGSPPVVFGQYLVAGASGLWCFMCIMTANRSRFRNGASDPFSPVMRDRALTPDAKMIDWRTRSRLMIPNGGCSAGRSADDKASIVAFLAAFDALRAA